MSITNNLEILITLRELDNSTFFRLTLNDGKTITGVKWGDVFNGQVRVVPNNNLEVQAKPGDYNLVKIADVTELEFI